MFQLEALYQELEEAPVQVKIMSPENTNQPLVAELVETELLYTVKIPPETVGALAAFMETPEPAIPIGELQNRYGKTNSKVYFRKEPSTKASKLDQLGKNTYVYMIYTQENSAGEVWTYAQVNGKIINHVVDYNSLVPNGQVVALIDPKVYDAQY